MISPSRRDILRGASAWAAAGVLTARAQDRYPSRPVTLVVSYPPGGQNDITARAATQPFAALWGGAPVLVDNRAGASGVIGAQYVAKAVPDGYTLLLLAINHTILPAFKPDMPYDVEKDFVPVSLAAVFPIVLIVNPSRPYRSVQELIAYAKANPGKVTFGSSGAGGGEHLAGELFCAKAGIKMLHVPYKGSAPALTDLLGGQIDSMFCAAPPAIPFIKAGKLRGLGVSTQRRSAVIPELPTIAEAGVAGYESNSWVGIVAPAGTPVAVVEKINSTVQQSLNQPSTKARLVEIGGEAQPGTPEQFRAFIHSERLKWAGIIKQADIRLE